jgi:serine protease AprX
MKDMGTATRADDLMASYSSKGPTLLDQIVKPDLVAPGNSIISGVTLGAAIRALHPDNAVPVSYYKNTTATNLSGLYFRLNGTSMAAPMAAGAAALLLQKSPELTPDQVKARLMKTASKAFPSASATRDHTTGAIYQVTYDLFTVGAGYLDIPAALNSAEAPSGSALSPRAAYDPAAAATSIVVAPGSAWANTPAWGTAVVWGSNVIVNGTAVVGGSAVVWGTHASGGFAVIWGSDTVWPNSHAFPDSTLGKGDT